MVPQTVPRCDALPDVVYCIKRGSRSFFGSLARSSWPLSPWRSSRHRPRPPFLGRTGRLHSCEPGLSGGRLQTPARSGAWSWATTHPGLRTARRSRSIPLPLAPFALRTREARSLRRCLFPARAEGARTGHRTARSSYSATSSTIRTPWTTSRKTNIDGSGFAVLASDPCPDVAYMAPCTPKGAPTWSPDGSRIAFESRDMCLDTTAGSECRFVAYSS